MANKLYTEDITKYQDWGGDESTTGLPVSGEKVQKFIKDSLQSKFGCLYFDNTTNKYLIFSDTGDKNLWLNNPDQYDYLILDRFDAPAPASFKIDSTSSRECTVLSSEINSQNITIGYSIFDKDGTQQMSAMSVSATIQNGSNVITIPAVSNTDLISSSTDVSEINFNNVFPNDLGNYLNIGNNIVTIVLTSLNYGISTTVLFSYNVLRLSISSNFDYQHPFEVPTPEELDTIDYSKKYIGANIECSGAGRKFLVVELDGRKFDLSTNDFYVEGGNESIWISNNNTVSYSLIMEYYDTNKNPYSWVTPGKHNIQIYFYIENGNNKIKSETLYYDFIIVDETNKGDNTTFILITKILGQGQTIDPSTPIQLNVNQYEQFDIEYTVFNTNNNNGVIPLELSLKKNNAEHTLIKSFNIEPANYSSQVFTYTYMEQMLTNTEELVLRFIDPNNNEDLLTVYPTVIKSDVDVDIEKNNLVFEFNALNRNNNESPELRNKWEYNYTIGSSVITISAQLNNVLFNKQNGWIDNTLVLNNGAFLTVDHPIFDPNWDRKKGLTFEIDFETADIQDDNANIMKYGKIGQNGEINGAGIEINACNTTFKSQNGSILTTNYKDNSRQKIQFIFNPNPTNTAEASDVESPYLMYLVVNGILDRAAVFNSTETISFNGDDYAHFTIGNLDNKVTTKIHSIRLYNKALTLDQCVNNYITESGDIRNKFKKNDILDDNGSISIDKVLAQQIPVMLIYGDITKSIVKVFNKKSNVPIDVLYRDPKNPQFNYFAHDAWMSNQGTSSMNYPRRNLRLYFNKTADDNTIVGFGDSDRYKYNTRVWHGLTDETKIAEIQKASLSELSNYDNFTLNGVEYYAQTNSKTMNEQFYQIDKETAKEFVHAGIKIYSSTNIDSKGKATDKIKKLSSYDGVIYAQGGWAKYKDKSLYTDRWTLKCDYAESSMTHNSGIGRLWNDVMKNVKVGASGFRYNIKGETIPDDYPCRTNAQAKAEDYANNHNNENYGDIRTSCDGYPIVIFNCPRKYKDGNEDGFEAPIYLGLYNIMTDKSSTPLFGFEDLKDEDGNVIVDAGNKVGVQRTECWECLKNSSELAQMSTVKTDKTAHAETVSSNKDRIIWESYEPRWPDNKDLNNTITNKLETLIRFVNFCKDAVDVRVDGKDGYSLIDYAEFPSDLDLSNTDEINERIVNWNGKYYLETPAYDYKDKTSTFVASQSDNGLVYMTSAEILAMDPKKWFKMWYLQDYASQNTTKTYTVSPLFDQSLLDSNNQPEVAAIIASYLADSPMPCLLTESIDEDSVTYKEMPYDPNITEGWYYLDKSYDRSKISKTVSRTLLSGGVWKGKVYGFDGKRRNSEGLPMYPNATIDVYLIPTGNSYQYLDETGAQVPYNSPDIEDSDPTEEVSSGNAGILKGQTFRNATKLDYFKDKKYEHFDVWKLAAYYVYFMRFAAVDQIVKNTMLTTEDGKHYYFINYDNDTILGVRNDGHLKYDWEVNRETYDESVGNYAYAGFGSVLWNLLEQDDDFMNKVQIIANAMVTSGVLTYDKAINMFNVKQSGTWSERLYNYSEMYKYIGIYKDIDNNGKKAYQNTKYLPFLQGSRASHRDWWLRHRFDLYDSMWSAGEYAINKMDFYINIVASPSQPLETFKIVAASKFYFTWLMDNRLFSNNFKELNAGEEYTFVAREQIVGQSQPCQFLGVQKAKTIDFSNVRELLGSSIQFEFQENTTPMIQQLIIGGNSETQGDCQINVLGGLNYLKSLEELDIQHCVQLVNVNISELGNLRKFLAKGSRVNTFIPAEGLMLEEVSLPNEVSTIKLDNCYIGDFDYEPSAYLTELVINNCKTIEGKDGINILDFIKKWYNAINTTNVNASNYSCKLAFDIIEIDDNDFEFLNNFRKFFGFDSKNGNKPRLELEGTIKLIGQQVSDADHFKVIYDQLRSNTFSGSEVKLWDDSFFISTGTCHFDTDQPIMFVDVTSSANPDYFDYNEISHTIKLVSGQSVEFKATIFPMSTTRQIKFVPSGWFEMNGGNRYEAPNGTNVAGSVLINTNGIAKLTTVSNSQNDGLINIDLSITDNTDTSFESWHSTINVLKCNVPSSNNMIAYYKDGDNIVSITDINSSRKTIQRQEISDVSKIYDFYFTFENISNINVDVTAFTAEIVSNSQDASFDTTLLGSVTSEIKQVITDDSKNYELHVYYTPKLYSNDIDFYIVTYTKFSDGSIIGQDSLNSRNIPITLNNTNITSITVEGDNIINTSVDQNIKFDLENYITSVSDNQNKIVYTYTININPNDYNVRISEMKLRDKTGRKVNTINDSGISILPVITKNSRNDDIISELNFEANLVALQTSSEIKGWFEIYILDEFNNEIKTTINYSFGIYYPDSITFIKTESKNGIDTTSNTDFNIDLLLQDNKTITYDVVLKSYVNGNTVEPKTWFKDDGIPTDHLPSLTNINAAFDLLNINNQQNFDKLVTKTNNALQIVLTPKTYDTIEAAGESICDVNNIELTWSSTFNNVQSSHKEIIYISKSGAVAFNGEWNTLPSNDEENYCYFMDNKLRIFAPNGINESNKNDIIVLLYVYGTDNKKIVSLDCKLLVEDYNNHKTYYWFDNRPSTQYGCAMVQSNTNEFTNYEGYHNFLNCGPHQINNDNVLNSIFENVTNANHGSDYLNTLLDTNGINYGQYFEIMVKYYSYFAALKHGAPAISDTMIQTANGCIPYFANVNTGQEIIFNNNEDEILSNIANKSYNIEYNRSFNNDMIFSKLNYYKDTIQKDIICRPLTIDEYTILFANINKFDQGLQKLNDNYDQNLIFNELSGLGLTSIQPRNANNFGTLGDDFVNQFVKTQILDLNNGNQYPEITHDVSEGQTNGTAYEEVFWTIDIGQEQYNKVYGDLYTVHAWHQTVQPTSNNLWTNVSGYVCSHIVNYAQGNSSELTPIYSTFKPYNKLRCLWCPQL